MGHPQESGLESQSHQKHIAEKEIIYEDEINLIDYLRVLWRRKYFISLGSVLPALLAGLILFFLPGTFRVTYVYDVTDRDSGDVANWNLDKRNYDVLLNRFYSAENINRIADKLRQSALDRYAEQLNKAATGEDLKRFVEFEVWPEYTDLSRADAADAAQLEEIRQLKAHLLRMTITACSESDCAKTALVVRDNFENLIPVYSVADTAVNTIIDYKTRMARIEENRFSMELGLKTNRSILAKLKSLKTGAVDTNDGNVVLQFNGGGRDEYSPLMSRIQMAESKVAELEENIRADEAKYDYYKDLLSLNERVLGELKNKESSCYTMQQFRSFLADLADSYNEKDLKDYLSSYIKKVENRISVSTPVTDKANIYPVPKNTVRKSAIVFAVCLMISVLVAFLIEGLQKSEAGVS
ncbi:MAG TPA: hypothetical protein VMW16_10440 [Sedimentisphaerales bacterium]|nr:hypothetical protein [Sedimentisphaerales bacterium]